MADEIIKISSHPASDPNLLLKKLNEIKIIEIDQDNLAKMFIFKTEEKAKLASEPLEIIAVAVQAHINQLFHRLLREQRQLDQFQHQLDAQINHLSITFNQRSMALRSAQEQCRYLDDVAGQSKRTREVNLFN
jgi:hypothetical protein